MTAIDGLLEAAGKLGEAGMTAWAPLLEEMTSAQASLVEALLPFLAAMAIDMEPFRYGFQLPPGQSELKPGSAEPAGDVIPPAVNIGPVNVYAIAREITRAMENLEQETTSVPDVFSSYASPGRMTAIEAPPAGAPSSFLPAAAWPSSHAPEEPIRQAPEHNETARRRPLSLSPVDDRTATGLPRPASAARQTATAEPGTGRPAQEWIEPGMKRSLVAMGELHEAYRSIVWPSAGQAAAGLSDALSVAPAAVAAVARVPEFPAGADEAHVPGKTTVTPLHQPAKDGPAFEADGEAVSTPGLHKAKMPKKTVMVPPIMPRPPILPFTAEQAESAAINARRLAEALASSVESVRPPSLQTARGQAEGMPAARAEWPRGPAVAPPQAPAPEMTPADMPVASVARSFAAMGNYVRAAAGMGLMAIPGHDGQGTPVSIAPGSALLSAMTSEAPPVVLPSPAASSPAPLSGYPDTGTGALPARGQSAWLSPAAGLVAAQAMQRSGLSAVQRLLLSAPRVPGDPGHMAAPSMSADLGRSMSWAMPASPALASGAESIVNITVPPPQPGRTVESTATTRVSNFHNTFNISVTVRGGEERDLKELGKKIGQILSDEIKRYGEI